MARIDGVAASLVDDPRTDVALQPDMSRPSSSVRHRRDPAGAMAPPGAELASAPSSKHPRRRPPFLVGRHGVDMSGPLS